MSSPAVQPGPAMPALTIALSKGRIYEETLPLLAQAGIEPLEDPARSRKLVIATNLPAVRVVVGFHYPSDMIAGVVLINPLRLRFVLH